MDAVKASSNCARNGADSIAADCCNCAPTLACSDCNSTWFALFTSVFTSDNNVSAAGTTCRTTNCGLRVRPRKQ